MLMATESFMESEEEQTEDGSLVKMAYIIQWVSKNMFLSKIENILYQDNVPAMFVCSLMRFMKCLKSDFKNCLPIFTTLDVWSILSQYLKPTVVMKKYQNDSRVILYKGKNKRLVSYKDDQANIHEAFALDAISIIQLVLESVKQDYNVATIIVRSVPFIENMLKCIAFILQNHKKMNQKSSQSICDNLFFNATTLLHYLLSFNEEDTFKVLCGLFHQTSTIFHIENPMSMEDDNQKGVEEYDHFWPLMIEIIDNSQMLEVHYSTVRLVAALIQSCNKLANGNHGLEKASKIDPDKTSYGVLMCYNFWILFKQIYFPKKTEKRDFSESFKTDICSCLSILLLHWPEAKITAIKENLIQKLCEKANDLCWASRIASVQNKNNRTLDKDTKFFERECVRILKILKNTFYHAGDSLDAEVIKVPQKDPNIQYNVSECPAVIQKLIEIYENVSKDTEWIIFNEITEVLCTLCAQSTALKKWFSIQLKDKKYCGVTVVLRALKKLNFASKGPEIKLVFNLAISLSMVPENVKKIIKDKTIEDIIPKLLPSKYYQFHCLEIKSEKDILSMKTYMTWFVKFLAAFTYNEEGIKAIMVSKMVLKLIDPQHSIRPRVILTWEPDSA